MLKQIWARGVKDGGPELLQHWHDGFCSPATPQKIRDIEPMLV